VARAIGPGGAVDGQSRGHMGVDRAAMNRAVFQALKPGGHYFIADHSGRPGTGISEAGMLHRIEEAFLRLEVEAAGVRLLASGGYLRSPNDPPAKMEHTDVSIRPTHGLAGDVESSTTKTSRPVFSMPCSLQDGKKMK